MEVARGVALPQAHRRVDPEVFARDASLYMRAFDAVVAANPTEATSRAFEDFLEDVFRATNGTMSSLFALHPASARATANEPGQLAARAKKRAGKMCEVCGRCANYGVDTKRWCAEHSRGQPGARRL